MTTRPFIPRTLALLALLAPAACTEWARLDASDLVAADAAPDAPPVDGQVPDDRPVAVADHGADAGAPVDGASDVAPATDAATVTDTPPVDAGTSADTGAAVDSGPPACGALQERCGGECRSLLTDPQHCGSCGRWCMPPAGGYATCNGGFCSFECHAGMADCDGNPSNGCEVDLRGNRTHCGACGNECLAAQTCDSDRCQTVCESGMTACSGRCVNTGSDRMNCGACGRICPTRCAGQICWDE